MRRSQRATTGGRRPPPNESASADGLFRALAETAADAVVILDARGVVRFANRAAARLFALGGDELVGRRLETLLPDQPGSSPEAELRRRLAGGARGERWEGVETTVLDGRGRRVPVEVSLVELRHARRRYLAGFLRDLRPRRRAEAGRQRSRRRLEALNRLARLASEELELRPMLQRLCEGLAEMFDWEFVACLRVDPARRRLVCGGIASRLPTELQFGYPRPLGDGIVGRVALTGEPLLVDDVGEEPRYFPAVEGVRSELCVPIEQDGAVVAVLDVESSRRGAFRGQVPLLQAVAEQVAGAIAAAERYEEALRRARLLEILQEASQTALAAVEPGALLERIVTYLEERFGFPVVEAVLVDERERRFSLRASTGSASGAARIGDSWPLSAGGIVGRALRTGETQLVADVRADPEYVALAPDVATELVVPIRFHDRTLGAFNFEAREQGVFTPEVCALLQLLASQVAGAVHLTALNRRLARTRDQLAAANRELRAVNRDLASQSRTDPLTGCANRRSFEEALEAEWRRAHRSEAALALLLVDVDHFKPLNDARGHREGDRCLKRVAQALGATANRAGDLVARYGGDEFVLMLPGLGGETALEFAERIRSAVEDLGLPHGAPPGGPVVTVSVGVASQRPHRGGSPETLFTAADRSLLEAKRRGRNTVVGAGEA